MGQPALLPGSYQINFTSAGADAAITLGAFSGGAGGGSTWDPNTPANSGPVTGTTSAISIAGLENSASEATTVNGDMILWLVGVRSTGLSATTIPSGFAGTTALAGLFGSTFAYEAQATAGTAGTQTGTVNGAVSFAWVAQMVAIRAVSTQVGPFVGHIGHG